MNLFKAAVLAGLALLSCVSLAKPKAHLATANFAQDIAVGTEVDLTIAAYDTVYYSFTTTDAGSYTIGITQATTDLGWMVTDANDQEVLAECDSADDKSDEVCQVALAAGTTYNLIVDEYSDADSMYKLLISKD